MAAHNHSEAYDLALFEPKEAKIVELKPNKKMQKAERRRTRAQKVLNTMAVLAVSGVIVGVVSMMVTSRVQLTEMNRELNQYQQQLSELKSEETRLEAELARQLSAQSVDEYAAEQGMTALESNQIHFVTSEDEETVTLPEEPARWWDSILDAVTKIFS